MDDFYGLGIQIIVPYSDNNTTSRLVVWSMERKHNYHLVRTDSTVGREYFRCWTYKRNKARRESAHIKGLGHRITRYNVWVSKVFWQKKTIKIFRDRFWVSKPNWNLVKDLQGSVKEAPFFIWLQREDDTWNENEFDTKYVAVRWRQ